MSTHDSSENQLAALNDFSISAEGYWPWLVKARADLAELKGFSALLENHKTLLLPLLAVDSLENCSLDGTNLDLQTLLENQLFTDSEQSKEARTVLQVRESLSAESAVETATNMGITDPIQLLLRIAHTISENPNPIRLSEIRNINPDNIGVAPEEIEPMLEDLRKFVQSSQSDLDPLVKALMIHCQLELIQPFIFGNGRIARAFLNAHLVRAGLLRYPLLLLSSFLQRNKINYLRLQREVKSEKAWTPYLKFMLHSISVEARMTREKIEKLLDYLKSLDRQISKRCPAVHTPELVETLVTYPVISPLRLSAKRDIHYTTATRYLKKLAEEGFLVNRQSGKYQLYSNLELINILSADNGVPENDGF